MTRTSPVVGLALVGSIGLSAVLSASLVAPTLVAAQSAGPTCQMVLGFRAFHNALGGDTVGECTENQRATAGGAEQRTTRGLLVWDAATNRVSFTDGYHTWVGGPRGIQQRLNSELFAWERPAHAPPATAVRHPLRFTEWLGAYVRAVRAGDAAGFETAYQHLWAALQRSFETLRTASRTWLAARLAASTPGYASRGVAA